MGTFEGDPEVYIMVAIMELSYEEVFNIENYLSVRDAEIIK